MVANMEWEQTERGYRLEYNGHELGITRRRPDSIERRTFVVHVDGKEDPVPLWNLNSAKTRAIRAVTLNRDLAESSGISSRRTDIPVTPNA